MTYTIKLENARQVSTVLDALNTQEAALSRTISQLEETGVNAGATVATLWNDVHLCRDLRKLILSTNADAT